MFKMDLWVSAILFVSVGLSIVLCEDEYPPKDLLVMLQPTHEFCAKEIGLTDDEIYNYDITTSKERKLTCYMACFMKQINWMSMDGEINYDYILNNAWKSIEDIVTRNVKQCLNLPLLEDHCDLSYSFAKCLSNHDPQAQQNNKRRSQIMAPQKGKPTLEIYRPPNVRSDGTQLDASNPKLNVHAKEFTMRQQHHGDLQTSRSTVYVPRDSNLLGLQPSRSSGNVLRHPISVQVPVSLPQQQQAPPPNHNVVPLPLLQCASSGNILHPSPRVHFQLQPSFTGAAGVPYRPQQSKSHAGGSGLKRSKSMSAADSASLASKLKGLALQADAPDLGEFPPEIQTSLQQAVEDPNKLPARTLMELAKNIMERVMEDRRYSLPGAKICAKIIGQERTETFLESLLNICQQWYQERDRILRNVRAGEGSRFTAFMWFLTEMSCQLKRHRLQRMDSAEKEPPGLVLLALLARCCQACVQPPIRSLTEVECLFFVLTSIGRDLEQELPAQLDQLLTSVRDGFLASAALPAVRKTLLQLIELKASNWQLSGPTVLYYYPKMK